MVSMLVRPAREYFPRKSKNDINRNSLNNTTNRPTIMSYRPMLNLKINQIILRQENRDDSLGRTVLICLQFDLILKTKF